jgi:hypothetical protein
MSIRTPRILLCTLALAPACFDPGDSGDDANDSATAPSTDAQESSGDGDDGPSDDGPSDDGPSDDGPSDDGPSDGGPSDDGPSDDTGASSGAASDDDPSTSDDTTDDDADSGTDASTTDTPSDDSSSTGEPAPLERIVFLTSGEFSAQAVSEAADRCQEAADAAGLPGTYLAWVSYGDFRPADDFTHFDGPYILTDGNVVADDWDDLTDGFLQHAIDHDENGAMAVMELVWTNTEYDGSATFLGSSVNNCSDFTSTDSDENAAFGRSNYTDDSWTEYDSNICSLSARFYCFQQ